MFTYTDLETSYNRNNPSSDVRTVDLDFTPKHETMLESTLLEIDHQLTDDVSMSLTYSYHTRDYEDWADYDHSVSVLPYALGPIVTNVGVDPTTGNPGVGLRSYDSEQNIDYSANESEWSQTEVTFSSDFDGKFNFTAGYYYNETSSETDYHIKSPSLMYYGNTSNGPHCVVFATTCNLGGIPYWGTFFASLPGGIATATGMAQAGLIAPSAVLGTCLLYTSPSPRDS